jgi:site-specific recombinase XerD
LLAIARRLRGLAGARDKALLLVGFAGAFRRSELVALEVTDLRFAPQG